MPPPKKLKRPRAPKIPHKTRRHGHVLHDDYNWMRERKHPKVLSYLKAENAYTDAVMKPTEATQKKLYREMVGRIKETDCSVPVKIDKYYYYYRTKKGKQYTIQCRRKSSVTGPEEVFLDVNRMARGHSYFQLGACTVSPDHRYLAYAIDTNGNETYTLRIKDLKTGKLLPDEITGIGTNVVWAEDGETLFYVMLDPASRPFKLFRHRINSSPAQDCLVYHETDDAFFLSISKTKSRKFLLIETGSRTSSEVLFLPATEPAGRFKMVERRRHAVEYSVEHHGKWFYIVTNDHAKSFRLMRAPVPSPGRKWWREVIGHRIDVKLEDFDVFADYLVLYEREKGLAHIRIMALKGGRSHRIKFPEPVYTVWGGQNPEFNSRRLRFAYNSLVTPTSVYEYDMKTRRRFLKKQMPVLGGYKPTNYKCERVFAKSHDGTAIPISLVYRRGMKRDGTNPLLLYGYGSYGISIDPEFSSHRISLLNRGFIYAIAHIRGGGDLGRVWYEDGKLLKKKNTFEDFIASAEHVIQSKYTARDKLVIYGGSAGGLLMGAVINKRPDLFYAVIAKVPFVDIMNTMLDKKLPLTIPEYEEWGNPEKKKYFSYMRSYSPYDNVTDQRYPHMLITGGLNDPRVQYWEPAKWTAKLREVQRDDKILLLKMNMGAGHGGASGRYDYLREIAFDYAFLLDGLRLRKSGRPTPKP
ncbi:MAG: S9 family peptidase [Candidatus Omnitrophota bacterium]|nr:S9 family peptidase [Candidatus Omnitrophota bacterium]